MPRARCFLFLLASTFLLAGCHTVVGTGRSQVNVLSRHEEVSLGEQAFEEATANATIIDRGPEADMVRRVGRRIVRAAGILYPESPADYYNWKFVLIDDDAMVNAWAAPGGKVAVYTGMLRVTRDEAGLAVVLGHEVAHVLARHGGEQVTHAMAVNGVVLIGSAALGDSAPATREIAMQALVAGGQYGVMLPYSRIHEAEADEIGLFLTADAGYDPRTAITVWERMESLGGSRPPEFLSTHPDVDNRIEKLESLMPEAMRLYRQARRR